MASEVLHAFVPVQGDPQPAKGPPKRASADVLFRLAGEAEPFCDPSGRAWADFVVDGHRETWPVFSRPFRAWLVRRYVAATNGTPRAEAVRQALDAVEARALGSDLQREVYLRVAGQDGLIYLDLADAGWRTVEISPDGWRIITSPPVRFRRTSAMRSLPAPTPGGSLDDLQRLLNVAGDGFVLIVSWLLAALRPSGPYPVLAIGGEQGSGKSAGCCVLRALVDPSKAPLRSVPRDERDLMVSAAANHVIGLDNVSALADWQSDALCRLATGGGLAARKLYTDDDEHVLEATRPALLNGIGDTVGRPDLMDRALVVTLAPIPEEARRTEASLQRAFDDVRPAILGALLDGVAAGLRGVDAVRLERLPRMADFAAWVVACEPALGWPSGTFFRTYEKNRITAVEAALDGDAVACALQGFMTVHTTWEGTSSDLLTALAATSGETASRGKDWPSMPRVLSHRLRRLAPALRRIGIEPEFDCRDPGPPARSRLIRLTTSRRQE